MLSFITWTNKPEVYQGMLESCKRFNFDAEYIPIYEQGISMARAYNIGTREAKGDILVYIHQDTRIHDPKFEEKMNQLFQNPNIGFAGPIGNIEITNGSWWTVGPQACRGRVHQGAYGNILSFGEYDGPARQLDALMMCTAKRFIFPEELPGIHFLDLWMCNEAFQQGLINWIFDSEIEHISGGETTSQSYHDNWKLYREHFQI